MLPESGYPLLQLVFPTPKADRNSTGTGITIFLDIDHYLLHIHTQTFSRRIDNTQISLVRARSM